MATQITGVFFEDAETWLKENMKYASIDHVCGVYPVELYKPEGTKYEDRDEGEEKVCDEAAHVAALQKLCDQIGRTLFVGGITNAHDLTDTCNWDSEVWDAFFQLVFHGEVIYG